ncbi:MAG: 6-bladed beta-propeller, partial [Bacteroidaceae bacterium]|nr:6-bladed beta-propeller [Bacteroidaceae bacterium]
SRGKAIYSFREDGTFLHQIGVRGRGRGEYLDIIDFTINPDNENIIILSNCSKINVYNNTGHFLLSKKLSESLLWSIEATNWGYVCSTRHKTYTSGEEAFLIYCFDKNFNLISRNIPVLPFQVQTPTFFSEDIKTADSSVFVLDPFGLSIYKIEGPETIKKAYDIQIKNFISEECLRDGMLFIEKQREYNWIYDWLITEKQIVCSYVFDKNYCISNYKIKDNEQDNFLFDFENSDGILPNLFNSEEGIFLSSCIIDDNSNSLYGIIRWRTKQN